MPNKWCVLFYWLLVCLDIPGELGNVHNRPCENEFYLHENENHFHMKGSRFHTEAQGNSEMAYCTFSYRRSTHFFSQLLGFIVAKSLVTNGSRLIAGCFGFTFHSRLC